MTTFKNISWNDEWLKQATWKEFKTLYYNHIAFKHIPEEQREKELYLAYSYLTAKKIVSLEKKYLSL